MMIAGHFPPALEPRSSRGSVRDVNQVGQASPDALFTVADARYFPNRLEEA
jgi:hypothetical protein